MDTRQHDRSTIAIGIALIVVGLVFFIAVQGTFFFNWQINGMDVLWPLFPMAAGVFLLVLAFTVPARAGRAGLVLAGTIPLLVGLFFLGTTTGIVSWSDQGNLWPVYPLIVGVAFLAAYAVSGFEQQGFLIPGLIISAVGVVFLGINLTGASYDYIGKVWPIFLILAGALLLIPMRRHPVA